MEGASSISVAVRVRPFSDKERSSLSSTHNLAPILFNSDPTSTDSSSSTIPPPVLAATYTTPQPPRNSTRATRKVLKVLDDRILVFDPPESTSLTYHHNNKLLPGGAARPSGGGGMIPAVVMGGGGGKKVKDIRFCFDRVFDEECGQEQVYDGSAKELVGHVMNGFHSTVFAYGATGCGKTHTISGSATEPGIVFLIMKDLFSRIAAKAHDTDFSLTVSYLEIYNETIRDLLCPESGPLALRENNGVAAPAGLSTKEPLSANDVVEWIMLGNTNRTVNATEANATSSRSHAVLSVTVSQKPKAGGLTESHSSASLSVIDLAGSERASVTKNKGDRLIEGANINRSLLALGNCINALCDPRKRGHVPYRDSKLTRLLKQSLGGNCKTVMIVCVSPSSQHYDETHNTLQYANRAKEIKTKAIRNIVTVDRHVQDYCRAIAKLQQQVAEAESMYESRAQSARVVAVETDKVEVESALRRIRGPWDNVFALSVRSERARVERVGLERVIQVVQNWRRTTFRDIDTTSADLTVFSTLAGCDSLLASLASSLRSCSNTSDSPASSLDMFIAIRNSISSKLTGTAAATFTLEVKILDLMLEAGKARAREEGILEASQVQARAMSAMCEARARVVGAWESQRSSRDDDEGERLMKRLGEGIDLANREAFLALTAGSSFAAPPIISTSSFSLGSTSSTHKRDTGTRSPPSSDTFSHKSVRATITGLGSSASGALASPLRPSSTTTTIAAAYPRKSPRKNVQFPTRANPSIKSSPKKKKNKGLGVQWRDETGDGWELEDVRRASLPAADSSTTLASEPVPFPSSSATASTSRSSFAGVEVPPPVKRSSAMGPLRSSRTAASSSSEPTSTKPFSFILDHDSSTTPPVTRQASRSPLLDTSNNSGPSNIFSMASTSSGLYAPLLADKLHPHTLPQSAPRARRVSTIGPLRSTKSNHRTAAPIVDLGMSTAKRVTRGTTSGIPKSPRRSSAEKRNSVPPAAAAAVMGSKSEARIIARRESSMATSGLVASGAAAMRESLPGAKGLSTAWR